MMNRVWFGLLVGVVLFGCATQSRSRNVVPGVPEAYVTIPFVEPGGPIVPPQAITRVEPRPSLEFVRANRVATATAELVIDSHGTVVDVWYVEGNREFGQVFVSALRGWKFKPGTLNGEPLTVRTRMTTTFRNHK